MRQTLRVTHPRCANNALSLRHRRRRPQSLIPAGRRTPRPHAWLPLSFAFHCVASPVQRPRMPARNTHLWVSIKLHRLWRPASPEAPPTPSGLGSRPQSSARHTNFQMSLTTDDLRMATRTGRAVCLEEKVRRNVRFARLHQDCQRRNRVARLNARRGESLPPHHDSVSQ